MKTLRLSLALLTLLAIIALQAKGSDVFTKKLTALKSTCSVKAKILGEELSSLQKFMMNKSQTLDRNKFQKALDEESLSGEFYRLLSPYAYTPFINDAALNACYANFKSLLDELKKSDIKGAKYRYKEWKNCYLSAFKLDEAPVLIKTVGACISKLKP